MIFVICWYFSKLTLKKSIFRNSIRMSKQYGSRACLTFCWTWSGSRLFAKVIIRRHLSWQSLRILFLSYIFIASFKTPSPRAYYPEKVHPQGERHAPKYSIGFRSRNRKQDQNPAPNNHILPPVMGPTQPYKTSAASFSMTGKTTTSKAIYLFLTEMF